MSGLVENFLTLKTKLVTNGYFQRGFPRRKFPLPLRNMLWICQQFPSIFESLYFLLAIIILLRYFLLCGKLLNLVLNFYKIIYILFYIHTFYVIAIIVEFSAIFQ